MIIRGPRQTGPANARPAQHGAVVRWLPAWSIAVAVLVFLSGCGLGGPRDFRNENDRLRRANLELERQVDELQDQLQQRMTQVETLRQREATAEATPMPDADPPMLTSLELGRYSSGLDVDDDGVDDRLRFYLKPVDQQGRVLPVAGRAVVQAVAIPSEGEPRIVAERTYEPEQFDRRWRDGFTGRHYTLELELPDDLPDDLTQVTAQITFTQARTGIELSTQQAFRIRHR